MFSRLFTVAWLMLVAATTTPASAQSRHGGHGAWHHGYPGSRPPISPVTVNPTRGGGYGAGGYGYPTILVGWGGFGYLGPYAYPPPLIFPAAGAGFVGPVTPQVAQAPLLPALAAMPRVAPRPVRRDANRAKELTTFGDRLFRAGNLARAAERYEQAARADHESATPHVRMAQIDLVRGKYAEAAEKLRQAQTIQPGWLATAGDVQSLYPEPADFARHVAKLEAHLQAQPEDRDGWLVLGALWYLSGRTEKAADVFVRLSDRKEDPTLKAFLEATKAE